MKPYRIKHIKSGLYYQPVTKGGNNLGPTGKVYMSKINGLSDAIKGEICIAVKKDSRAYKLTKDVINWKTRTYQTGVISAWVPVSEFEIEYLNGE